MCLAVPGRVLDIGEKDGTRMATVDFGGVVKEVCLEYLPDLQVGEYAIVHVGFALQRLDEESAKQTLELFAQLGMLQEEFGDPWEQAAAAGGEPWPFTDDPADGPAGGVPAEPVLEPGRQEQQSEREARQP
ncbi:MULTISPECIES: HypC/HybG/HupF family hydrogenase formation chaperone [Streptomyces]|uniref:HypC/HybG/HupF family hydrogenase formation chaperone n=1 Tax=Streptomyces TaxID=1883 RepID=UPI00017EA161|nr:MULTISPECIES: HypC/HybG/HupF family hydrogenase formation chaperone [Streptomyces]EDX25952.1 hydrogenase expression/formation protein [Streptomyces sp. Mg1]RPK41320.1 Hydrogenase isoenzymes formation protein HypC [Streptomyces sp. ADI91-18]WBY18646.1 HypC/HybG/HupF family hydrogenase formation chaperone [Streptomyces goshikiensis]